jgi:hypothetical protein
VEDAAKVVELDDAQMILAEDHNSMTKSAHSDGSRN